MDVLNGITSVESLQHFIDQYKGQDGVIRFRVEGGYSDDVRLFFTKNEHRHHNMNISSSQILKLSHTVPGLQFRAPGYENEETDYHADRVKAYVKTHGYYVWGSGNDHAEWVTFVRADQVDTETAKHYNVPQDVIDTHMRKPGYMMPGYKRKKGTS